MSAGRNEPCPCGSGRKFKHCCGAPVAAAAAAVVAPADHRELAALAEMVSQGRLQQAEESAATLLSTQADNGLVWKVLGVAQMRQGKDALAALERAAQLLPEDAEAHANLGAQLHDRADWEAALVSLRRALALEPRNPDALVDAADAQRALGRPREALTLYQWALQIDPRRVQAHNNLGNAFLELGDAAQAARCYRQALELVPQDAQVMGNLADALRQLGQLKEAMAASRAAIALEPGLAMAHNNLGLLLDAQGEPTAALASYREALRLRPAYVEALVNLGKALRGQGERREALAAYAQAVELEPRRADSYCQFGYALLESRHLTEAAASFERALLLQPQFPLAQLGLAATQRVQRRPVQAEASCALVLSAAPRNAEALALRGELHADRGEFAQARALFERAIEANPEFAAGYASIAALQRMTPADGAWLAGAQRLLARQLPLEQEIQLHFALGKYFDDNARYEEAFGHYRRANELTQRRGVRYDPARLLGIVERVTRFCSREFIRGPRVPPSDSQLPVFIIGMPRSGTSLAEQILASHPMVFGAGEVRFWDRAFGALEREGTDCERVAAGLTRLAHDYLAQLPPEAHTAQRVTDKMPTNFLYAGLIHAVLPRARLIHMQRHPLDTCLSVYFQHFLNVTPYANDLTALAHYYAQYQRLLAGWRRVLPVDSLLEVPYEGLVADPETWTRRMLEFIGLPFDARCLEFHQTERVVITASRWQVRQKLHRSSMGRWRNYEKHLAPLRALLPPPQG